MPIIKSEYSEIIFRGDFLIERILGLMKEREITAKELTEQAGLNHGAITDWKNGKSKPGTDAIVKIAEYFNVDAGWLLTGKEPQGDSIHMTNSVSGNGNAIVGANHGSVIVRNGQETLLSESAAEILRVLELLDMKQRHKLLAYAYELEDEKNIIVKGNL